ncbi:hypothetical protein EIP86_001601 [Pleurotus ostreatoroseus]|nr:hypothetical protein EIP86_001601 [Pleurotus ostreatoroseus]
MWTPIDFSPVDILDGSSFPYESLNRSAGAPCQVAIDCNGASDGKVWKTLATRCHEITRLQIDGLEELRGIQHLDSQAPLLESLSIGVAFVALDARDDGGPILSESLPLLFAGHTPSLRDLTVHYFTSSVNRFAGLTAVHISHQSYNSPSELSHLFSILEASPKLQVFSAKECGLRSPSFSHITVADIPRIFLSRLRKLSFEDCHPAITNIILYRLELPHTDGVLINCPHWRADNVHPPSTVLPVGSRLRIRSLHSAAKLQINYDLATIRAMFEASWTLIKANHDPDTLNSIIPSLRLMLRFNTLQEMWLAGIELHSAQFWQGIFGEMTALRKLVLHIPPVAPGKWLRALNSWDLNGGSYPAPKLQTLWVFPPFRGATFDLVDVLQQRGKDGYRIQHLRLLLCSETQSEELRKSFVSWRDGQLLEELVDNVSFDMLDTIRAELAHSLSRVQWLRNTQAPVNTLPPEILLAIFEEVGEMRSALPLTHVCQYWRELALRNPSLWASIDFSPTDMLDDSSFPYESLKRSTGVPCQVSIDCKLNGVSDGKVWKTLNSRCHEITRLHIGGLQDLRGIQQLNNQAPLLEELSIGAASVAIDLRDDGHPLLSEDLPLLFSGQTPSLRKLIVHYFTGLVNRFASLTTLYIFHQSYSSPSDLLYLFSALQASSGLEIFSIEECGLKFLNVNHISTTDMPIISLSHLHRLSFAECDPALTRSILYRLELPRTDDVLFKCINRRFDGQHPASAVFPIDSPLRIRSLQSATKVQINYNSASLYATFDTSSTLIKACNAHEVDDLIIPSARFMLQFNVLQELWLSGTESHSVQFWQGVFGEMTALQNLVLNISSTDSEKWLRALRPWDTDGRPYPAPALQTLWVFPPVVEATNDFFSMLQKRYEDGHRIKHLRVLLQSRFESKELRQSFSTWKRNAPSLESFTDDVSFDTVMNYPRLDYP